MPTSSCVSAAYTMACTCSTSMLSMETTESVLGISSHLIPRLIRVDTTDVASLLAVSMETTAPTLFIILTS